jgi:phosphoenolpyruvate phosphomutase
VNRELEDPKVHANKIKAACDHRMNDEFMIIARTESLIVGNPMEDAVHRANVYTEAGADAILIHHKGKDPTPIFQFSKLFNKVPLVIVPTTYNTITEKEMKNNFSIVIYPNYGIRCCVKAMQETFAAIAKNGTLSAANDKVVDMQEIFRLIGVEDLKYNERKYSE